MSVTELQRNLIERVSVGDILTRTAARFPDKPAVIDGDVELRYRELNERACRLANALLDRGLEGGEPVGLMLRNGWEFLVCYFACAKADLVAAPVNLGLGPREMAYCLNDAGVRLLLAEPEFADAVGEMAGSLPKLESVFWTTADAVPAAPRTAGRMQDLLEAGDAAEPQVVVHDRDPVQLLYTSGTTSMPKGVLTSHLAVTITALSVGMHNKYDLHDTALEVLPLFHCAALNSRTIPALLAGSTVVLLREFDARQVAGLIERYRITSIFLLPMMYRGLLADPEAAGRDLGSVRLAVYAMTPLDDALLARIAAAMPGAAVVLGSGQTEFTPPTTHQRPEHQASKAASWGPSTPMVQVEIMDPEGRLLPRGEIGEIVYRGPQVMNGYLNLPDATGAAMEHGWFHSGDVGYLDDEGVVWFTDRKKDMIKTGGENVASIEVERLLLGHPDVADVSVIGFPDERWGEAVTALVIPAEGRQPDETGLIAYCKEHLAGFKVPKRVYFMEEFPRTGTGKIQKHMLRKEMQER
ncbi:MAG TPA: long-chain-fatty-acid--CoA ligase [Gammaproteobacteria bacterium]|nr:long-chain-fatty-acid--CoA ligase [Gammaproteobacteria bacterium]